jgi:hypothetical protein
MNTSSRVRYLNTDSINGLLDETLGSVRCGGNWNEGTDGYDGRRAD